MQARVCVEKTHHPEGDLLNWRASWGVARIRESRPRSPGRQRETRRILGLARAAGDPRYFDAPTARGDRKSLSGREFTERILERETGFEPATLGLEGRCSSR